MVELAKMADIYRGAVAVVCLIPETLADTSEVVAQAAMLMDGDTYRKLETSGDIYGSYMFATKGECDYLLRLYGSRWWERAWTFQEAVLNRKTHLVSYWSERGNDPYRRCVESCFSYTSSVYYNAQRSRYGTSYELLGFHLHNGGSINERPSIGRCNWLCLAP